MEQIYPFDIPGNSRRLNPREQLLSKHTHDAKDTRIMIPGMRNLFRELQKSGNTSQLEKDTIALMKKEQQEKQKKQDKID